MVRVVKAAEERRGDIIEAARRLFLHKGYESTTMHDVMKALDVAKGTIYHYYRSKEELLDAVLQQLIENERQRVQQVFDELQGDALSRFRQLIFAINVENHDQAFIDSLHKPANAGMHIRLHAATVTMLAPFFAELCRLGIQEGVMQAEHPLETAEFILAATTFLTDTGISPWSTERLEKRFLAMPDLIERLLGAPSGSFAFLRQLSEGLDLEPPQASERIDKGDH